MLLVPWLYCAHSISVLTDVVTCIFETLILVVSEAASYTSSFRNDFRQPNQKPILGCSEKAVVKRWLESGSS